MLRTSVYVRQLVSCPSPARWLSSPASAKVIYTLDGVTKRIPDGNRVLFRDVSLQFIHGEKIGLIGANGAGKSSLLRIIAGRDADFQGKAFASKDVSLEFLTQEPELDPKLDVLGNVMMGVEEHAKTLKRFEEIAEKFADPDADFDALMKEQEEVQHIIDENDLWNLERKVLKAMSCLRCPEPTTDISILSGGEKRRVALARMCLRNPDLLLLDEPTNHLDAQSIDWLEAYLQAFKGTVIAVTHDRYFLENVAGWILEVHNGDLHPHKGNYSSWVQARDLRIETKLKQISTLEKKIKQEQKSVSRGTKGQVSVSKAKVGNLDKLKEQLKEEGHVDKQASGQLVWPPGPSLGNKPLEVRDLCVEMDERILIKKLTFSLGPGRVIGIIGPNGCGKSTLFRVLTGELKPKSGKFEFGNSVKLGYVKQNREFEKMDIEVHEAIGEGDMSVVVNEKGKQIHIRSYVAQFNFKDDAQTKTLLELSGGERNRVHLAKMLKGGHNVILLDEPTNDLDMRTLESLEEGLSNFNGSVLVISHDRWFLDKVCTDIISFEGDGNVVFHEGNLSSYLNRVGLKGQDSSENANRSARKARAATFL